MLGSMSNTQFSGTSLKVNEDSKEPEEDRSITIETLAGFSSTFKLLPENCVSNVQHQLAENPPLHTSHHYTHNGYVSKLVRYSQSVVIHEAGRCHVPAVVTGGQCSCTMPPC